MNNGGRAMGRFFQDKINIENLEVFANHGVYPEENRLGQKFLISLSMRLDTRTPGIADDIGRSVNYGEVCHFLDDYMKRHTYRLIEAAAENLAEELLLRYPLEGVSLRLKKPWAPVGLPLESVSVEIERSWHTAYIGLGSNLGDKKGFLDQAVRGLSGIRGCRVERVSDYIVTEPYGGVEQDDFLNACLVMKTFLPPGELLERLQDIERDAGRERTVRWGPRTLDLDILMYDDAVIDEEDLVIPHAGMHLREFVLRPLAQIAPHARHPILRRTAAELLAELGHE